MLNIIYLLYHAKLIYLNLYMFSPFAGNRDTEICVGMYQPEFRCTDGVLPMGQSQCTPLCIGRPLRAIPASEWHGTRGCRVEVLAAT